MFIFVFGILGNILNIIILSQRSFRSNPCVIIFLGSSAAGIITILSGLTSRVLSGITADLSGTINWICKFRGFILFTFRCATFWLIMLATGDRWLLSSIDARRRQMSSIKNSLRGIFLVVIVSVIVHSQLFYCYEANLIGTPLKCFTRNIPCRLMNDLTFAVVAIVSPLILILIFGLMTISNMRKTRNRIVPKLNTTSINSTQTSVNARRDRLKKIDQKLFLMLFVQVILLAIFTLPLAIQKLYATLTMDISKSSLEITIEDFIYQIALICTYFAAGMPFYVNTLSGGTVFNKAIWTFQSFLIQKLRCRTN